MLILIFLQLIYIINTRPLITEIIAVKGLKSLKALFISNKGGSFELQIILLPRALQGLLFPFEKLSQVIFAWFFIL